MTYMLTHVHNLPHIVTNAYLHTSFLPSFPYALWLVVSPLKLKTYEIPPIT